MSLWNIVVATPWFQFSPSARSLWPTSFSDAVGFTSHLPWVCRSPGLCSRGQWSQPEWETASYQCWHLTQAAAWLLTVNWICRVQVWFGRAPAQRTSTLAGKAQRSWLRPSEGAGNSDKCNIIGFGALSSQTSGQLVLSTGSGLRGWQEWGRPSGQRQAGELRKGNGVLGKAPVASLLRGLTGWACSGSPQEF